MKAKKGFVLIEFMLHLALIAISLGLAVVYYQAAQKNILPQIAQRELSMLNMAVFSYHEHYNPKVYPSPTVSLCADRLLNTSPLIIARVFYDPFSKPKREYHYALSQNGQHYCLWSVGKNRKSNISGIDNQGNVFKDKNCDDIYLTDLNEHS